MIKTGGLSGRHPDYLRGKCELCGGHRRELRIMAQADFIGWACEDCRRQLFDCQIRRFCSTGEQTESAE